MEISFYELSRMQAMDIKELERKNLAREEDIAKNPFAKNIGAYSLQIGFMEGADCSINDCAALYAKRKRQQIAWEDEDEGNKVL